MDIGQGLADAGHAEHHAPAAPYNGDGLADLGLFLGGEVTEICFGCRSCEGASLG
ncbi:hypothetical protein ACFP51_37765 [Streptomyces pratens]|uniref:Uncharacterized protein n=1 Tax=Streptomyces pratens TaxID=887456 RepID=A0ABW1MAV0_9ACTN